MTARVSQLPTQVLYSAEGKPRVSQMAVQVLWGIKSSAIVAQIPIQVLYRKIPRRVKGVTY